MRPAAVRQRPCSGLVVAQCLPKRLFWYRPFLPPATKPDHSRTQQNAAEQGIPDSTQISSRQAGSVVFTPRKQDLGRTFSPQSPSCRGRFITHTKHTRHLPARPSVICPTPILPPQCPCSAPVPRPGPVSPVTRPYLLRNYIYTVRPHLARSRK